MEQNNSIGKELKNRLPGAMLDDVAERLGITRSALYYQLTGKVRIKEKTIKTAIDYLKEKKEKEEKYREQIQSL
jgi:AcrR family transcriptional regulator